MLYRGLWIGRYISGQSAVILINSLDRPYFEIKGVMYVWLLSHFNIVHIVTKYHLCLHTSPR